MKRRAWMLAILLAALAPAGARGEQPAGVLEPPFEGIGFDQNPGAPVPQDLVFLDESGSEVRLGDFLGRRPVILSLAYYRCPMLCTLVLNGLASSMRGLGLEAGADFTVVTVSIDPRETPQLAEATRRSYLKEYGRPDALHAWRFLTGRQESIAALAAAAGFRYAWDATTEQYAHPSGIIVLTPDGRISRYLLGVEYAPRDLRLALVEASEGRIGTVVDRLLLLCYRYDPATGRYGAAALGLMRAGGVITMLAMAAFVVVMLRRDARRARAEAR